MKIFLSAVSSQFKACRDALGSDLSAVGAQVVVQEDFQQHGFSLLEKLEQYIASCDRVIALIGDGYGWEPEQSARPAGRPRRSYTQWEYYFACGERLDGSAEAPKPLYVYFAAPEFIAALSAAGDADPAGLQRAFVAEVCGSGKDRNEFKSLDELRAMVLRDGFRLGDDDPKLHDPSQRAVLRGNHNIVVQIHGDANRVDIGRPYLSLVRYGELAVRDTVGLLYAQARAIPLFGREETLNGLEAWANGSLPISIRVIVGGGGSGKTRLAMELCDRLTDVGWDAGFITAAELGRFHAQQNLATWGWSQPTLAVIDYAAARAASLSAWLAELASNPGKSNTPLRVLLLERHAEPGSGWWQAAFGAGGVSAYVIQGLLDPPEPVRLLPLAPPQRRQVLDAMLERLDSSERVPAEGADPSFDHRLANLTWGGDPLYLMIAASRAAQAGLRAVLALTRTELVKAVSRFERARLAKHAPANDLPSEVLCHMAAFVTLCGGLDWEALADAVPAELQALRRPNAGDPAEFANALREALPGMEGTIAPVQPDPVGESFVLEVLAREGSAEGVVKRAWHHAGLAVAEMLIRCAQDFGQAEREPPLTWLQSLADEADDTDTLDALLQRVPESTVILRSFAARLSRRIVETLAQDDPSPDVQALRANSLNNMAKRLSEMGDRQGALAPAREAVDIYRELAAKNPDAFRPDLAGSLNNLAIRLSAVGAPQGALATASEAEKIYRDLAAKAPDDVLPALAMSCINRAIRLSEVGDLQGALAPAREAAAIYRELAARNPNAFLPGLGMSLTNVTNRLSAVGDLQGALASAREAEEIYRELAARNPDAFRPDLAISLNNLADCLREAGDPQEAMAPAREAVELYRELAAKNVDAFHPALGGSLNNLAICLSEVGDLQGALAPARKAVEIYRELAVKYPDTFRSHLAVSLYTIANCLRMLGDRQRALAAAREAEEIRRGLAVKDPDAFRPALATSLNLLATCLSKVGDRQGSLALALEAVEIYRELAAKNPDAFRSALGGSLNNVANSLGDAGDGQGALAAAREAVEVYRELAAKNSDAFRPDLATSLDTLAVRLSKVGDRQGALAPARKALSIRRELAVKNPDAFRPDLAMSLHNLAIRLSEVGDRQGALASARKAVAIYRELAVKNPDAFRPDLAMSLHNLAIRLSEVGDRNGALAPAREAVKTLTLSFVSHPHTFVQLMEIVSRYYLQQCQDCQSEPDTALLGPIFAQIQKVQGEEYSDQ